MANHRSSLLFCLVAAVATSCKCCPDLVVTQHIVTWDTTNKSAHTRIENVGNAAAGPFMVYVDGEETPESANHRPQVRHSRDFLAPGDSFELHSDFLPLAHPDNQQLSNVHHLRVIVDPKSMVKECKEDNNERTAAVGPGSNPVSAAMRNVAGSR